MINAERKKENTQMTIGHMQISKFEGNEKKNVTLSIEFVILHTHKDYQHLQLYIALPEKQLRDRYHTVI